MKTSIKLRRIILKPQPSKSFLSAERNIRTYPLIINLITIIQLNSNLLLKYLHNSSTIKSCLSPSSTEYLNLPTYEL